MTLQVRGVGLDARLRLIGFSQSAGDARAFASKHRYRIEITQESVAQGMANLGSGLVQGIPVSTSLSASSLNDQSGARTQMSSLTTGVLVVVVTLILLAPLFSGLPVAVLAALIIDAVVFGMMDVAAMRRLYRVKRFDFWIAIAAIVGVLSAGVLAGVVIGVVLSIGWLIYVSAVPKMPVLGHRSGTQVFVSTSEDPETTIYPGLLVMRFDAGLYFVSADALEDGLREQALEAEPRLHTVVLDFEGVNFIDSQRAEKLAEIVDLTSSYGVDLRLTRVKGPVLEVLELDGVVDQIGRDKVFGNVYSATEDVLPPEAH